MRSKILLIVFVTWVALWAIFTARELFIKDNMRDYRALAARSLEGKHSYVAGERLYPFLVFCKANLPAHATYQLAGAEDGSLDKRRSVYYLYPLLEAGSRPDFILAFDLKGFVRDGYSIAFRMDEGRYVLKREEAR